MPGRPVARASGSDPVAPTAGRHATFDPNGNLGRNERGYESTYDPHNRLIRCGYILNPAASPRGLTEVPASDYDAPGWTVHSRTRLDQVANAEVARSALRSARGRCGGAWTWRR